MNKIFERAFFVAALTALGVCDYDDTSLVPWSKSDPTGRRKNIRR
jgi:hypothetical protein